MIKPAKWAAGAVAALLVIEAFSFVFCIAIQRFDFVKWSPALRPLPVSSIARRVGFLYQNQFVRRIWLPDPLLQFRLRPNGAFGSFSDIVVPGLDDRRNILVGPTGFVKNNSDPSDGESIRPGDKIVFMTGGSPVAGEDMPRNEDTVPSQLERWLRERCQAAGGESGRIRVINAGAPSYTATQELTYFLYDLFAYRPVAWVQLTGINEPWHIGMLKGGRQAQESKYAHGYPDSDPLARFNFFPATQKLLTTWLPMLLKRDRDWSPAFWREPTLPTPVLSAAERFLELQKKADGAAAASGVSHYLFLQPTEESDELRSPTRRELFLRSQTFARGMWDRHRSWAHEFYSELRPKFKAEKRPHWFDLVDSFPASETHDVYETPRHFSPYGASLITQRIGKGAWAGDHAHLCGK